MQNILQAVITATQEVATFQMKHFRSMPAGSHDSKDVREMVSFVDVESEKILLKQLTPLIPEAGTYGEETGKSGNQALTWVIDPLDGTTNYLSGLDTFSISVALVENGTTTLGVIHKPASGEIFASTKGNGVTHNGTILPPVSTTLTPQEALYVTGFPYRSPDLTDAFYPCAHEVLTTGRGLRRFASAALDVANLSAGWIQGYWESDLQPYDIAAGMLFMEETGVIVTNHHGTPYNMFNDRLMVAALPNVHTTFLKTIQNHYPKSI